MPLGQASLGELVALSDVIHMEFRTTHLQNEVGMIAHTILSQILYIVDLGVECDEVFEDLMLTAVLLAKYYGRQHFGAIYGLLRRCKLPDLLCDLWFPGWCSTACRATMAPSKRCGHAALSGQY